MKIFYCKNIPFKGFYAMMILGMIVFRKECRNLEAVYPKTYGRVLNHEMQHRTQFFYTGIILFYPLYLIEYLIRLLFSFRPKESYRNISFEREARRFENRYPYSGTRFWRYYFKP